MKNYENRLFILAAIALLFALAASAGRTGCILVCPKVNIPLSSATGLPVEATPQAAPSTRATVDGDWQGVQTVALKMECKGIHRNA